LYCAKNVFGECINGTEKCDCYLYLNIPRTEGALTAQIILEIGEAGIGIINRP
jgi:hypothetical protein